MGVSRKGSGMPTYDASCQWCRDASRRENRLREQIAKLTAERDAAVAESKTIGRLVEGRLALIVQLRAERDAAEDLLCNLISGNHIKDSGMGLISADALERWANKMNNKAKEVGGGDASQLGKRVDPNVLTLWTNDFGRWEWRIERRNEPDVVAVISCSEWREAETDALYAARRERAAIHDVRTFDEGVPPALLYAG